MLETANKIYKRNYTECNESQINGNEVLLFEGGGAKMVVLREKYFRDIEEHKKEQQKEKNHKNKTNQKNK